MNNLNIISTSVVEYCNDHRSQFVALSPGKGRGVFASAAIAAGTVIELSPVIVMSGSERVFLIKPYCMIMFLNGDRNRKDVAWRWGRFGLR